MMDGARVWFHGGSLLLPARTPYERELLLEHVDLSVRRHGRVRLELDERRWHVSRNSFEQSTPCTVCHEHRCGLTFAVGARRLCLRCARAAVVEAGGGKSAGTAAFSRGDYSSATAPMR
jgi:hypothetical protein